MLAVVLVSGRWPVGAHQAIVQFGVEDRKPQAVIGETVTFLAWDAGDEPVDTQPGQVVAGLVHGVGVTKHVGSVW